MNSKKIKKFEAVVISGSTGSGKNKIANILGKKTPIMIINADAIQVYKKWKILSGRPSDLDQRKVTHKLYGHYNGNHYSVGKWLKEVILCIDEAKKQNLLPVFVGGNTEEVLSDCGLLDTEEDEENIEAVSTTP